MDITLPKENIKKVVEHTFYTEEEQSLLEQLEKGFIQSYSHEDVMKRLHQTLKLSKSE